MDDTEYEVQKALGLTKVFCVYATRDDACTTRESFEVRAIDKDNAILRCKGHITKVDPDCEWREWHAYYIGDPQTAPDMNIRMMRLVDD